MWKKVGVVCVALCSMFSVVYAMNHEMFAAEESTEVTYKEKGTVTGKLGPRGSIGNTTGVMNKGDKIMLGVNNTTNNPLSFQLVYYDTGEGCSTMNGVVCPNTSQGYTDYVSASANQIKGTQVPVTQGAPLKNWYSMSVEPIKVGPYPSSNQQSIFYADAYGVVAGLGIPYSGRFENGGYASYFHTFNSNLKSTDLKIVAPRNLQHQRQINSYINLNMFTIDHSKEQIENWSGKVIFPTSFYDLANISTITALDKTSKPLPIPEQDLAYTGNGYHIFEGQRFDSGSSHWGTVINANGSKSDANVIYSVSNNTYPEFNVRAAVYLDVDDIVFGISQANTNQATAGDFRIVSAPSLPASYTNLYRDAQGKEMKVRLYDETAPIEATLTKLADVFGNEVTEVGQNHSIFINATANAGKNTETGAVNTISVLVFDKNNNLQYYKPITTTIDGNQYYEFDTTGLPIGEYQIAIVNEEYSEDSSSPAMSSLLTAPKSLKITDQAKLTAVSYTAAHAGNDASQEDLNNLYQTSKDQDNIGNVSKNDKLGYISATGGMGNTKDSQKISYRLLPDTKSSEDYKMFEIPVDSTSKYPLMDTTSKKAYIQIKEGSNARTYLDPGVYTFRIQSYDEYGNPYPAINEKGDVVEQTTGLETVGTSTFFLTNTLTKKGYHGIISDDITTVVYPHTSQITYAQIKQDVKKTPDDKTDDIFYQKNEVNAKDFSDHLGTITFDKDAKMKELQDAGYTLDTTTSKLMKKGKEDEQLTGFKITADAKDPSIYYIDKGTGTIKDGDNDFDAWLYFKNAESKDVALLKVTNQTLYIAPSLSLLNPEATTKEVLEKEPYERKYDAYTADNNTFTLTATDKSDFAANTSVHYCILNADGDACDDTPSIDTLTLSDNNDGTATIVAKPHNKEKESEKVRAYIKIKEEVVTYKDLEIKILKAERKLVWEGTDIGSTKATISKSTNEKEKNTFLITLPYDASNVETYSLQEINTGDVTTGNVGMKHDAGTGVITYSVSKNVTLDTTDKTFKLTDNKAASITVEKAEDDLFERGTAVLQVTSETKPALEITAKWQLKADSGNSWTDASNPLTFPFSENGTKTVKVSTSDIPSDAGEVKITYVLEETTDAKNTETITVATTEEGNMANITMLKASQTLNYPSIKATITTTKYATKTVSIPVKVNKIEQTLDFSDAFRKLKDNVKITSGTSYSYAALLKIDKDTTGSGTLKYTVSSEPTGIITDDTENHSFIVTKSGKVKVEVEVTKDGDNYTTSGNKKISKTITFYDNASIKWTQSDSIKEAVNTIDSVQSGDAVVGAELGTIAIDGGKGSAYSFSVENTLHSDDASFFKLDANTKQMGASVKLLKCITANDLQSHSTQVMDENGKATDQYTWTIPVKAVNTKDDSEVAQGELNIVFTGAAPNITFTNAVDKVISGIYGKNATINLSAQRDGVSVTEPKLTLSGFKGIVTLGSDVTTTSIVKANADNDDQLIASKKVEIQAEVSGSNGFKTGTSAKNTVLIKKASHPEIIFDEASDLSSFASADISILGILDDEAVTITPPEKGQDETWTVTPNPFTKDADESMDAPFITVNPDGFEGCLTFHVQADGNDLYKPLPADTTMELNFTAEGGLKYKKIEIFYGDDTKNVKSFITSPNPEEDSASISYEYSDYDASILAVDADGNLLVKHTGKTSILVKRKDASDASELKTRIPVTVQKKPITMTASNLNKLVGQSVESNEFSLDSSKSDAFLTNDLQKIGTLQFSCQDNNVEVTQLPNGLQEVKNIDIIPSYTGADASIDENYVITYQKGILQVKQDASSDSWFTVLPDVKENGDNTIFSNGWYNGPVKIQITASAGNYDEISKDNKLPWASNFIICDDGIHEQDIYFRNSSDHALASTQTKSIKVDSHAPSVTKISAKDSGDTLQSFLNTITFGIFFKPKTEFTITTVDTYGDVEVSKTAEVKYTVEKKNSDGTYAWLVKDGSATVENETALFKVSDQTGIYRVCTSAVDNAGNQGENSCREITQEYKDMNIDTGDHGCTDINIDYDGDGIADLNVDLDGDRIPDLNIDSDHDGEADINVDSDHDSLPDLNLVILKKWDAQTCKVSRDFMYATMTNIEPEINVIIDNGKDKIIDQIPSLNIDTNGDMKADLNITDDANEVFLNILTIKEWKPEKNYTYAKKFQYDTIKWTMPLLNYDSDKDGKPDINIDFNKDNAPDLNVDSNYDGVPDFNIDGNGDGEPDLNLDVDDNGKPQTNLVTINEWLPDLDGEKGFAFDTMRIKGKEELEDNGIIVKPADPNISFLPNFALKVNKITDSISDSEKGSITDITGEETEVKEVYDVKLMEDNAEVQPSGKIKVRIPADTSINNPKLMMKAKDGTWKLMDAKVVDGYFEFETDYIGAVSVVGDKASEPATTDPEPVNKQENNSTSSNTPTNTKSNSTSVKGTYTNGVGGALTGDQTNAYLLGGIALLTSSILVILYRKRKAS